MAGDILHININPCDTIYDLKTRINSLNSEYEIKRQKLMIIYNYISGEFTELDNNRTLASYSIETDTTIYIFLEDYKHKPGKYLRTIGLTNTDRIIEVDDASPTKLIRPIGICISENNELFIADTGNHRIQIFSIYDSEYLGTINRNGMSAGTQHHQEGICVNSGQLFVSDTLNQIVQVFDSTSGTYLRSIGAGHFNAPSGLCVSKDGELFVADSRNNNIIVFNISDGKYLRTIGTSGKNDGELHNPSGLCIWLNQLFVADSLNNCVQIFSTDGKFIRKISNTNANANSNSNLSTPWDICIDSDGILYVTSYNNNRVVVFNASDGEYKYTLGNSRGKKDGQFYNPCGICVSSKTNELFVADSRNHRIQVFAI